MIFGLQYESTDTITNLADAKYRRVPVGRSSAHNAARTRIELLPVITNSAINSVMSPSRTGLRGM